jgi:hypothetical protein
MQKIFFLLFIVRALYIMYIFCVTSTVFWKNICLWFCHIVPV